MLYKALMNLGTPGEVEGSHDVPQLREVHDLLLTLLVCEDRQWLAALSFILDLESAGLWLRLCA